MQNTLKILPPTALLTLDCGGAVEVQRAGRGRYTTAWRCTAVGLRHVVYLVVEEDRDSSKEIVAQGCGEHLPTLKKLGAVCETDLREKALYETIYYAPLTAKSGDAWEHYKVLKDFYVGAMKLFRAARWDRRYPLSEAVREANQVFENLVADAVYLPDELKSSVASLMTWACSYPGYLIEIAKRNLAVDAQGRLILLDPCFDASEVVRKHEAQLRRAGFVGAR